MVCACNGDLDGTVMLQDNCNVACVQDRGKPHYQVIMHGVSEQELLTGQRVYVAKGAGPLKNKTQLGPANLLPKVRQDELDKCIMPCGELPCTV